MRLILTFILLGAAFAQNVAQFPLSVPSYGSLGIATNRSDTTLSFGITSSATSFTVPSGTGFSAPTFVTIDNEILAVCRVSGNTLTVGYSACPNVDGRGFDGSVASSHLAGAHVQARMVARYENQRAAEIVALATKFANEMVSVRDKGAKGDGVTDDTGAFQLAVSSGKSLVLVPPGTYLITSIVSLPSNVTLRGWGPGVSIIRSAQRSYGSQQLFQNSDQVNGNANIAIEGMTLDGNEIAYNPTSGANQTTLADLELVTGLSFRNVQVIHYGSTFPASGTVKYHAMYISRCVNVLLQDVDEQDVAPEGVGVFDSHHVTARNISYTNNYAVWTPWHFLDTGTAANNTDLVIDGFYIDGAGGSALYAEGQNVSVSNGTIRNAYSYAINAGTEGGDPSGNLNVKISNVSIYGMAGSSGTTYRLGVAFSGDGLFMTNVTADQVDYLLTVDNGKNLHVSHSKVTNIVHHGGPRLSAGLYLNLVQGAWISSTSIDTSDNYGYAISNSSSVYVSGGRVANAPMPAYLYGDTDIEFSGVKFDNSGIPGFTNGFVSDIGPPGSYPPSDNVRVTNCDFRGSISTQSIALGGTTNVALSGNTGVVGVFGTATNGTILGLNQLARGDGFGGLVSTSEVSFQNHLFQILLTGTTTTTPLAQFQDGYNNRTLNLEIYNGVPNMQSASSSLGTPQTLTINARGGQTNFGACIGVNGSTTGMSISKTVKGADGNSCSLIFTCGLLTSTTCP